MNYRFLFTSLFLSYLLFIPQCNSGYKERNFITHNCDTISSIPSIGDSLNIKNSLYQTGLLIKSGQISPGICKICDQIRYTITVSEDSKVNCIATWDSRFITPEKISLKSNLSELIQTYGDNLHQERGMGWTFILPSGWEACFVESNSSYGVIRPEPSTKVSWFLRRK